MLRSLLVLALVGLAACRTGDNERSAGGPLVATTVSPITSIVEAIAGVRADVRGIIPEGTNSHTFEPRPSVAALLSDADVVFLNGLRLEDPTMQLAEENAGDDARIVELGDAVLTEEEWIFDDSFPEADGKPNPHLWTDVAYVSAYAEVVRDTLVEVDPDGAHAYQEGFARFADHVERLDEAMTSAFATIPERNRKLLTYHDAYAYFARTNDFEVVGAIQMSDFEDPKPRELARLIDQIRDEDVPAVFGSEVFPSPLLEQLARETDVEYVDDLRDDDLPGEPGDPEHSLLELLRFNYVTITEALGGNGETLAALELPDAPDDAAYPQ